MHLYMVFAGHPPSVNAAYFTKGHLRILTPKGKAYKMDVKNTIATQYAAFLPSFTTEEMLTAVYILEYADKDELLCKGYPKTAKTKYKRVDVSNRIKLLEDAIVEATGIDDSQNFTVVAHKTLGKYDRTHVHIYEETASSASPIRRALLETVGMA
jgi:Holliday junction resolvase RusA-like endonuclease